jgi:hypothetical protein
MPAISVRAILIVFSLIMLFSGVPSTSSAQQDQASLLLDLKKARAAYDISRQKLANDRKLFENKAISEEEYNRSQNELLSREVDYQKLILQVIAQQSYIIVEKAVKYQNREGERRVKITIRSTMEGNQEYLQQFEQYFDLLTPEMRTSKIYNIFVSLVSLKDDKTIIGSPYEIRIPVLEMGKAYTADFGLLRDAESLQVELNYQGKKDQKNIYLEKDTSANLVDINSTQFSQEADLGSQATYDLTLERFSESEDVYTLLVVNLPSQVSAEFIDTETNARLSQIKFTQGVNTKKLSLKVYLPDRDDRDVVIDKPISFYALVLSKTAFAKVGDLPRSDLGQEKIDAIPAGKVKLELLPRGVGRIEVRATTLYHEITLGDSVAMTITVRNAGTRRLDNIRITTDNPLNWRTTVQPDLIRSLDPEKEQEVRIALIPPSDAGVGAQEVKIRTEAMANNRPVQTDDKTVRIQVQAKTPLLFTSLLVLALIGLVVGIVVFGIKISRR